MIEIATGSLSVPAQELVAISRRGFVGGAGAIALTGTGFVRPAEAGGITFFLALLVTGLQAVAQITKNIDSILTTLHPKAADRNRQSVEADIKGYLNAGRRPDGIATLINTLQGHWLPDVDFYRSVEIDHTEETTKLRDAAFGFRAFSEAHLVRTRYKPSAPIAPGRYRVIAFEAPFGREPRPGAFYATGIPDGPRHRGDAQIMKAIS
jgi:ABC-type multidrug transport system fused ATPase/permease subunit